MDLARCEARVTSVAPRLFLCLVRRWFDQYQLAHHAPLAVLPH